MNYQCIGPWVRDSVLEPFLGSALSVNNPLLVPMLLLNQHLTDDIEITVATVSLVVVVSDD
jgi:hypothetical protein